MPYAVVTNVTDADFKAVQFQYSSESDGVNHTTNTSFPFFQFALRLSRSLVVSKAAKNFPVTTTSVSSTNIGNISASYDRVTKASTFTVNPQPAAALSALSLNPTTVRGGNSSVGTVALTAPAPTGGLVVDLSSNNSSKAAMPSTVTVAAGNSTATFSITTAKVSRKTVVTISASRGGITKSASLTIVRK